MSEKEVVDIISLGAGVQSSLLLMKADRGEIKINGKVVIPKYAIMGDPGNEPQEVYDWLEYLKSQVKNIEIIVVETGNLVDDILRGIENNERFASVPFFTKRKRPVYKQILMGTEWQNVWNEDTEQEESIEVPVYKQGEQIGFKEEKGMLGRQCTSEYKIMTVRREIRRLLGYDRRERITRHQVRMWLGISTDEIQRIKPSQVKYIENVFPLIDDEISRFDCLEWFRSKGLPLPPKSACIICPYHSNSYWRQMKKHDPISWQMAVDFDKKIRRMPKLEADVFLHRSCKPLEEVDLGAEQISLFDNECEGVCHL